MPAGDHRGPRRRSQGAGRARRRVPRSPPSRGPTCCATANAAACPPRCWPSATARSGSGRRSATCSRRPGSSAAGCTRSGNCWRRCRSRPSRPPGPRWRRSTTPRTRPRQGRGQGVRGRVRRQMAQGGGEDHRRPRRPLGVLRLPRRALDPPADHEPDRVDLRHRAAARPGHQGTRLPSGRRRDGVQADRVSPDPVAEVNAPHLVALVRAGALFVNGKLVERPDEQDQQGGDQQRRKKGRSTGLDYSSWITGRI